MCQRYLIIITLYSRLCSDAQFVRQVWEHYDSVPDGTKLYGSLVSVLKSLLTEKPNLLGVSTQMFGVGILPQVSEDKPPGSATAYGFDVSAVAGMVANAASATMTNVVGMVNVEHGLSLQGSTMKLQWYVCIWVLLYYDSQIKKQYRPTGQSRCSSHPRVLHVPCRTAMLGIYL